MGDYAGKVYNDLKNTMRHQGQLVPKSAEELVRAASGSDATFRGFRDRRLRRSWNKAFAFLKHRYGLSSATAKFAVQQYVIRNRRLHSKAGRYKMERDWVNLDRQTRVDLEMLESFLPYGTLKKVIDKWRCVVEYCRDRYEQEKDDEAESSGYELLGEEAEETPSVGLPMDDLMDLDGTFGKATPTTDTTSNAQAAQHITPFPAPIRPSGPTSGSSSSGGTGSNSPDDEIPATALSRKEALGKKQLEVRSWLSDENKKVISMEISKSLKADFLAALRAEAKQMVRDWRKHRS
jgi:hypothetical protein